MKKVSHPNEIQNTFVLYERSKACKKDVHEFRRTNVVLPLHACVRLTLDVAEACRLYSNFRVDLAVSIWVER